MTSTSGDDAWVTPMPMPLGVWLEQHGVTGEEADEIRTCIAEGAAPLDALTTCKTRRITAGEPIPTGALVACNEEGEAVNAAIGTWTITLRGRPTLLAETVSSLEMAAGALPMQSLARDCIERLADACQDAESTWVDGGGGFALLDCGLTPDEPTGYE